MATVNQPTNTKIKEHDINQKLQLYGIMTAFSNGKVPSNKQIDVAMNSFLTTSILAKPSPKLSQEGRELIGDVKDVINEAKKLLLSKNQGNLIQDFIWQTQNLSGGNAKIPGAPTDKATAQQHGNEALDGLRTLGTLLISNGQFRKLLSDASILLRDIAGDAASNAATKINPSEDQLSQIDDPADDNTWHDTPSVPSKGGVKEQLKSQFEKNKPFSQGDAKKAAEDAKDTTMQNRDEEDRPDAQAGAKTAFNQLKNKGQDNVPDENQDQANETAQEAKKRANKVAQRSKNYLSKKMPQERREQIIWRLKKMIVEIQGHEDYQQAIETLLGLAETYAGHASSMTQASAGTVKGAHSDDSLKTAEKDLKTLIERFANCTSTDDLMDSVNDVYKDADRDPELKKWFKSMDRFVRKCLQEQGFILKESSDREWDSLYEKGHFLLRERYRDHTDRILDEFKFLGEQFDKDRQNRAFADSLEKLFDNLGHDENGKAAFKPHLIKDLTTVIIPSIFENTRYIPIPRIEASDPMVDAVIENLVIESDNIMPNILEFGNDSYYRMGRKNVSSSMTHKIMVSASGIQMDLKDVSYYVKKKEGFPSLTDTGVMDIFLGGEGFSFKLAASTATDKDRAHFVKIDNVTVSVKNLKIKIKKSNHKFLFSLAKGLLLNVMRPVIQKAIEKVIRDNFVKADAFAYDIYKEVQRAADKVKDDPESAPNIYEQYLSALRKTLLEKKKQAQEKSSDTKVNVAMTKHDSMFKNISLPGGISTKATEFNDLAVKGDKWESPVFSIGSAKESTSIPSLEKITRKPHNAAKGGVRGGNKPSAGTMENGTFSQHVKGGDTYSSPTKGGDYSSRGDEYSPQRGQAGFSNQVNQAFDLKQGNGPTTNGLTTGPYYEAVTR